MIGGVGAGLPLPLSGSLPPDLQGTLFRAGPAWPWGADGVGAPTPVSDLPDGEGGQAPGNDHDADAGGPGALHAVEIRDGEAIWYVRQESEADASVFWHAGSILALPETGIPSRYSRFLEPQEFAGGLTVPIASHVHRLAADGGRVLFSVDDGLGGDAGAVGGGRGRGGDIENDGIHLRLGEWDAAGALRSAQSVELERATWQHDIGVTATRIVFIESPTARLEAGGTEASASRVPFGWVPGAEGWIGVVRRGGDGSDVRWLRVDPCLVTHVMGAYDEPDGGCVLFVCCYGAPEAGQPVDRATSVVGPAGLGLSGIGRSLGVLERWRITGDRFERTQVDDRFMEYPRIDPWCEGAPFRYGYSLEIRSSEAAAPSGADGDAFGRWAPEATPVGVLKFDLNRDEVATWEPGAGRSPSEPLFVRATDGHSDEEGWLLTVVDDAYRGGSDIYVLDASSLGRRRPEAIIHLPGRLPLRSHGEWVPADRYR